MENQMLRELIDEIFEFGGCAKNGDRGRDGKDGKDGKDADSGASYDGNIAEMILSDVF